MEPKQIAILSVVLIVYLCAGAAIFREVEGKTEHHAKIKIQDLIDQFLGIKTSIS